MKEKYFNSNDNADPKYWKWGIFYYNKNDSRIFPPKRNPYMGWTINFANPKLVWFFMGLIFLTSLFGWLLSRL